MKRRLGPFHEDTLYEGDALTLLPKVPDGTIDLIVTDPPFAIDFRARRLNYWILGNTRTDAGRILVRGHRGRACLRGRAVGTLGHW